jgi:glycosyltransferase involved in cell wall biosynthesis
MSHWLADFINHREGESAKFVGGGLSETILSATPNQSRIPHSILFIGRDFKRKDGQLVVNAFRHLRRLFPDARLSIASLTVQEPEPGISWLGDVSAAQVSQLMASHQVFVMPSRFEAYGLVFLEAMANGMAIVGRNSFEMPWFVEQGSGLLIDSGNEEQELQQLVTAIKAIWNEPQFLAAARDAMGGIREAHSWQAVGERVIAAMQE